MKTISTCLLALCLLTPLVSAQSTDNQSAAQLLPVADRVPIADRAIDELLNRTDYMMYISDHFTGFHYAEAAAAYGALKYVRLSGNTELGAALLERYQNPPGTDSLLNDNHVDANVYGILPIERFFINGDEGLLQIGLALADDQWRDPLQNGMTRQTRYWIDDIWMINALQVQAFRATQNKDYLERAALQTQAYLNKLQQPNGLFHHGPDAPFFWGRGNGWVAAGLAELLSVLPEESPYFNEIATGYRTMMAALIKYQADDGMWRQLIDYPESWKESSGTAMFGYAFAIGVERGLLPQEPYANAAQKAWDALIKKVDDNGRLTDVCVGTGQSKEASYYLDRPTVTGDLHGQAPLLWFATTRIAHSPNAK